MTINILVVEKDKNTREELVRGGISSIFPDINVTVDPWTRESERERLLYTERYDIYIVAATLDFLAGGPIKEIRRVAPKAVTVIYTKSNPSAFSAISQEFNVPVFKSGLRGAEGVAKIRDAYRESLQD